MSSNIAQISFRYRFLVYLTRSELFISWKSLIGVTNAGDSDLAQYFPPGTEPSTVYGSKINCGGANTNGAVVVNLETRPKATGTKSTDEAAGAYGFVRFRGVVK